MDVAIVELVIAGLSSMDLSRWFAFQCYLRTLDGGDTEDSVHVQCVKKEYPKNFFPRLKEVSSCAGHHSGHSVINTFFLLCA